MLRACDWRPSDQDRRWLRIEDVRADRYRTGGQEPALSMTGNYTPRRGRTSEEPESQTEQHPS